MVSVFYILFLVISIETFKLENSGLPAIEQIVSTQSKVNGHVMIVDGPTR